jgi:hypothetical protein
MTNRIKTLPTRFPELGRLRSGYSDEDDKMQPLRKWRITTKDERAIHVIAGLYGGTPQKWKERPEEFELFSESETLNVLLPSDALFTAYEAWGSGGNKRRCDGETCVVPVTDPEGGHLEEIPCWCLAKGLVPGESKDACNVTVRLKVVMPDVPGLGVWMFTSGSQYAAMELPFRVDAIEAVRQRGDQMVPCDLTLDYREEKRAYEKFTRKYSVPVITVHQSMVELAASLQGPGLLSPRKSPPLPRAGAPAVAPGLPPGAGEPAAGSEEGGVAPAAPIKKKSWTAADVEHLLEAHDVVPGANMRESLERLAELGVVEL